MQVTVAGQRPDQYLESFSWDAAKFPPRRALNETVSAITENIQKLEDDLKVKPSLGRSRHVDLYLHLLSRRCRPFLQLHTSWTVAIKPYT